MSTRVRVSDSHLANAVRKRAYCCMYALALQDCVNPFVSIEVYPWEEDAYVQFSLGTSRERVPMPPEMTEKARDFDCGVRFKPFEFDFAVPTRFARNAEAQP